MNQANLFGDPAPAKQDDYIPKPSPVREAWGTPDAKGRYFYQKYIKEIEDMPKPTRDILMKILGTLNGAQILEITKMLSKLRRAHRYDYDDVLMSIRGPM